MISIKIQCGCGQKFAFDAEPVAGKMPWTVKCPSCGTDATNTANEIIARELAMRPAPPPIPSGLRPAGLPTETTPPPSQMQRPAPIVGRYGTVASNPARLRVNWGKANSTRPAAIVLSSSIAVAGVFVALVVQPIVGLCMIITGIWTWWKHYREVTGKFSRGDVCPGIILSDKLVAVITDLRVGSQVKRPAIKVMHYPLAKMTGGLPPTGSRVATVAYYYAPVRDGAWQNFSPEVIACWVTDENEIQRVTNSITAQEWQNLDTLLARIPRPEAGLYKMWGPETGKLKRAMDPGVGKVLATLILLAIFGPVTYGLVSKWKAKHKEQQPAVATAPAQPANEEPAPTPATAPVVNHSPSPAKPSVATTAPATPKPAPLAAIDLGGQLTTFTNLQGKSFENVRLLKADPRGGVIYSFDGGEGAVPFNNLSLEFIEEIGVPTNWPGVMQGRKVSPPPTVPASVQSAPTAIPAGNLALGTKIEAHWGGKWLPATVIGSRLPRIPLVQVHFDNPKDYAYDLWLGTNQVRVVR